MLPQLFSRPKLLPPRLGGKIMPRPRLIQRMYAYLDRMATIVHANAGCGKTTMVADFVQSCRLPSVWYQIDASDEDLDVFFGYLVYGLQRLTPDFGHPLIALLRNNEEPSSRADRLADVFVNEVYDHIEQKTILVLDDYHHVDSSSAISMAVDRLMRYLPDVLHVILLSRTMPNLSVSRLRSKGLIGIIDRRDLLFSPKEVDQLFADTFQCPLPPELITQIYEKTEGWVTALQLIQQSLERVSSEDRASVDNGSVVSALQQSETDVFSYLAEEVVASEPPEMRLALCRLSLFERISPAICESVFPAEGYREILPALSRRNVFIAPVYDPGVEEYRLHPLFRTFLKRRLLAEVGPTQVKELHRAVAAHFSKRSQWDMALNHYAEAGAADEIAEILADRGAELVETGRFEAVKRAFAGVQADLGAGREGALITRADVAALEEHRSLALNLYERAAQLARESGNQYVEAHSLRGQASIARHSGQFERAIELASAAIDLGPDLHSLRGRCLNVIGICRFISSHDTKGAIESWRAALDEARQAGDDQCARIVLHNLGLPYSIEGDLNEAIHWMSQMSDCGSGPAAIDDQSRASPFPQEAVAHVNLARLKMAQGRLEESKEHLEIALQRCRTFNLQTLTAETLETFGSLYRERADYAKSLEFYREAERAYRKAGLTLTSRELLEERAALYLQMGQVALAERDVDAYYNARRNGSAPERAAALIARGRVEMAAGRTHSAKSSLTEAIELSNASNLRYFEARAETSLARLYWSQDKREEAFELLGRAVELSIRYDYTYWLSSEAARLSALFQGAIGAGIGGDYLAQLICSPNNTNRALTSSTDEAAASGPVEPLLDAPIFDLTINMLGPIEIYRNQHESLPDDAWRLPRSLHILCYIVARRNRRAQKDTLAGAFWPDSDAETVTKNLHPMISHARKALNSGQVIKKDFIIYREGAYFLNPQYRYCVDIDEFERLLGNAAETRRSGDSEGASRITTKAIELYRGEYLQGLSYEWANELRGYYLDLYLEALKQLAGYWGEQGDYNQVIRFGQTILQADPYREDVHCQLMEAYVRLGNRAAAIEQFDKLRRMLRSELGVGPLPATVAKYETLIR